MGLEPATSAVTAKRKVRDYRKQASRMASFGAVRCDREPLSNPYQTHDLCPTRILPQRMSCSISTRSSRPPSLRSPSREPLRSRGRAQSRAHLRQAGRALHQLRQRCPLAKITSVFIFMDFQQAPIGRPNELLTVKTAGYCTFSWPEGSWRGTAQMRWYPQNACSVPATVPQKKDRAVVVLLRTNSYR